MKTTTFLLCVACLLSNAFAGAQSWYKHFGKGNAQQAILLNDGNLLLWAKEQNTLWVPQSFFLKLTPNGDLIEKIEFLDRGFSAIKQNSDGTFDAIGTLPVAAARNSPHWFHLSENMEVLQEVNLGLDSVEITGFLYPAIRLETGLFHANGDFTVVLNVEGPGISFHVARFDSNKTKLWLFDALSESLSYTFQEDFFGNYLIVGTGAVSGVWSISNNWSSIWSHTSFFPPIYGLPLPNGNALVMTTAGGFNNNTLIGGPGQIIGSPTSTYPAYDYGGTVNSDGEVVLTGYMIDTTLVQHPASP